MPARPDRPAWTPAEEDLLRRCWPDHRQRPAILAQLSHRTRAAVHARAHQIHVESPGRRWTSQEDHDLRMAWGHVAPRTMLAQFHGRGWKAIHRRAHTLGLDGIPQGFVALRVAAERLGYARDTLRQILAAHGVKLTRWCGKRQRPTSPTPGRQRRWLLVDLAEAQLAVEAHLAAAGESIHGGALARGVDPGVLRWQLLRMGAFKVKARPNGKLSLPSTVLDSAAQALGA